MSHLMGQHAGPLQPLGSTKWAWPSHGLAISTRAAPIQRCLARVLGQAYSCTGGASANHSRNSMVAETRVVDEQFALLRRTGPAGQVQEQGGAVVAGDTAALLCQLHPHGQVTGLPRHQRPPLRARALKADTQGQRR